MTHRPLYLRAHQPDPEPSVLPWFVAMVGFALTIVGVVGAAMRWL